MSMYDCAVCGEPRCEHVINELHETRAILKEAVEVIKSLQKSNIIFETIEKNCRNMTPKQYDELYENAIKYKKVFETFMNKPEIREMLE